MKHNSAVFLHCNAATLRSTDSTWLCIEVPDSSLISPNKENSVLLQGGKIMQIVGRDSCDVATCSLAATTDNDALFEVKIEKAATNTLIAALLSRNTSHSCTCDDTCDEICDANDGIIVTQTNSNFILSRTHPRLSTLLITSTDDNLLNKPASFDALFHSTQTTGAHLRKLLIEAPFVWLPETDTWSLVSSSGLNRFIAAFLTDIRKKQLPPNALTVAVARDVATSIDPTTFGQLNGLNVTAAAFQLLFYCADVRAGRPEEEADIDQVIAESYSIDSLHAEERIFIEYKTRVQRALEHFTELYFEINPRKLFNIILRHTLFDAQREKRRLTLENLAISVKQQVVNMLPAEVWGYAPSTERRLLRLTAGTKLQDERRQLGAAQTLSFEGIPESWISWPFDGLIGHCYWEETAQTEPVAMRRGNDAGTLMIYPFPHGQLSWDWRTRLTALFHKKEYWSAQEIYEFLYVLKRYEAPMPTLDEILSEYLLPAGKKDFWGRALYRDWRLMARLDASMNEFAAKLEPASSQ